MAESTDVNLPRRYVPSFPDRCVACECDQPESYARIITGTLGWWTWLLWVWGKPFVIKAPACPGCAYKLHFYRLVSVAVTIAVVVFTLWGIWPHLKDAVPQPFHKWAMMGLALLCLIPQVVYEMCFAASFNVTAFSDSVDYEFRSRDYAIEFALLNTDAEWTKINGVDAGP